MKSKYATKAKARDSRENSSEKNLTGKYAKPRHRGLTKREKKLIARKIDFEKIDDKRRSGYHMPGSLSK